MQATGSSFRPPTDAPTAGPDELWLAGVQEPKHNTAQIQISKPQYITPNTQYKTPYPLHKQYETTVRNTTQYETLNCSKLLLNKLIQNY